MRINSNNLTGRWFLVEKHGIFILFIECKYIHMYETKRKYTRVPSKYNPFDRGEWVNENFPVYSTQWIREDELEIQYPIQNCKEEE